MRYLVPIVLLIVVVAGLGAIKASQFSVLIRAAQAAEKAGPPPEVVSTGLAKQEVWEQSLPSVGTVTAAKGVTVTNDAPGVVSAILFDSGATVAQGQVLVVIDSKVEQAQLASAQAHREIASINVDRTGALVRSDSIAKAQLDTDESALKSSGADVNAVRAQIDRKVVRAPFKGRLGIRLVNLGQYLSSGTPLTLLESTDVVYVDFSLPQQHLVQVPVGTPVRVLLDGDRGPVDGAIEALDSSVDSLTRSVKLRARIKNDQNALQPGMFVGVRAVLPGKKSVLVIPATAVIHQAYGDSVFVVEGDKVRQQFVRVGESRGDFDSIEQGVSDGQTVVTAGGFKLRNGARVTVNNEVKQRADLDPHPENH